MNGATERAEYVNGSGVPVSAPPREKKARAVEKPPADESLAEFDAATAEYRRTCLALNRATEELASRREAFSRAKTRLDAATSTERRGRKLAGEEAKTNG